MSRWASVRRRLTRRRVVLLVALGVVFWMAGAVWQLLSARSALEEGRDELVAARRDASIETMLEPETEAALERAEAKFADARRSLRSPLVAPLRALPVVGRHVRAVDGVESSARRATVIATDAIEELRELESRGSVAGPERVELVRDLSSVIARARTRLAELDPGDPDALAGSVADAIIGLREERDEAVVGLTRAERATAEVADLLAGPGTYLLLGANNAEMRAGSGMFLSASSVAIDDGGMLLGDVYPVGELVLAEGAVPVEGDLARNWPWLDVGRDPRQLAFSADFPQSAEVAARWWAATPDGSEVDGVVVVDVLALQELLRVVGPVEIDGTTYSADTVGGELLVDQYRRAGDDVDATEARRDRLGDVARAVFAEVEAGGWDVAELATTLVDLVQGRHLLIWSADDRAQATWIDMGAAGALGPDTVSVAALNRGGHKLDPFITSSVDITTGDGAIVVEHTLVNDAPDSGPRYQVGPNVEDLAAGDHPAIVVVNLPAGTTDVDLEGARTILRSTDGPTVVVAAEVMVARGEAVTLRVRGRLPAELERIVIEPSARMPGTAWTVDGRALDYDLRRTEPIAGR